MKAQFSAMMVSIKCKVRYQRVFQRRYGLSMQHRLRQDIRRRITFMGLFEQCTTPTAKEALREFLEDARGKTDLKEHIFGLC